MATEITLNSYSLFCITENTTVYSYGYQEAPPTVCPHDVTHTIDTGSIAVVNTYTIPGVFINIDKTGTGGTVLAYGTTATFPTTSPGTVQNFTVNSLPFPVRVMSLTINPGEENLLDKFSLYGMPNTLVGAVLAPVAIGATTFTVNSTAYQNTQVGYRLTLDAGGSPEVLDYVISKAVLAGPIYQITVSTPTTQAYIPGTTVSISIPRILCYQITSNNPIPIAQKAPGTSLALPSMSMLFQYTNNDGRAKKINIVFDVFY